jgi:hypothetical protein
MCPRFQRGNLPSENTFPEFNRDELFYTSAFVMGTDRKEMEVIQKEEYV